MGKRRCSLYRGSRDAPGKSDRDGINNLHVDDIKLMMMVRRRMTTIRIVMMIMIRIMLMIGKKLTRYQFFAAPYRPQDFSKFLLCKSLVDKKHLR